MKNTSALIGITLLASLFFLSRYKNKIESIHVENVNIRASISEDFTAIMAEVRLLPSKVNNQDCFLITEIKQGSRFEETTLLKNDCIRQITSYKWDPQTITPSKVPEVLILNSPSQMMKIESILTAPFTVELILFRNQNNIQINYKIDMTM